MAHFQQYLSHPEVKHRILQMLASSYANRNMNDLSDCAARLCHNPIMLVDGSYNVLGYSSYPVTVDPGWYESIQKGYITESLTNEILEVYREQDLTMQEGRPFLRTLKNSNYQWMVANAYYRKHLVGTVNMLLVNAIDLESKVEIDTFCALAEIFANYVGSNKGQIVFSFPHSHGRSLKTSQKTSSGRKGIYDFEVGFSNLLTNEYRNKILLKNELDKLKATGIERFILLTIYFRSYLSGIVRDVIQQIDDLLEAKWFVSIEPFLLVILDADERDPQRDERVQEVLRKRKLKACLSDAFDNIEQLDRFYEKSCRMLSYLRPDDDNPCLITMNQYRFWDIVQVAKRALHMADETAFVDSRVLDIHERSQREHTDDYKTLVAFLSCKCSYKQAAEAMYCHRNTVLYRIGKIKEEYDIDFDDEETMRNLVYSVDILEHMHGRNA